MPCAQTYTEVGDAKPISLRANGFGLFKCENDPSGTICCMSKGRKFRFWIEVLEYAPKVPPADFETAYAH